MIDAGAYPLTYIGYYDSEHRAVRGVVPLEEVITLHVNGRSLVRLMCTPTRLEALALGFLFNEGLIESLDEIAVLELCGGGQGIDVWLEHDVEVSQLRAITSGCSGGTTFEEVSDAQHQVESGLRITPDQVTSLMEALSDAAALYHRVGGVHTAALAVLEGEDRLVCVASDVGRHNTLDKIAGVCLQKGHALHVTRDYVLLTSGRVSSEMVNKVAYMKVPIVISRTSPTLLSVRLARSWGITLIGYTKRRSFRVYAGEERVIAK